MPENLLLAVAILASGAALRVGNLALAAEPAARAAAAPPAAPPAEGLTPHQRAVLEKVEQEEFCYCGCPHTLAQCLRSHAQCRHAPRMARLAARMAGSGMEANEILRALEDYYDSFEPRRRVRLDLAGWGPPLGEERAPVALVEFSDFTCPHCQVLRPVLERFVKENAARVRLYYKPYPLAMHPRALEAALTAEWARGIGKLWPMYDALFGDPRSLGDADLAERAREVGGDPVELRGALAAPAMLARVEASQAEATRAGILGTPTLFVNGRRLTLPELDAWTLEFTLEDEEEWIHNGGWSKD